MISYERWGGDKHALNGIQRPFLIVRLEIPHLLAYDQGKLHLIMEVYSFGTNAGTRSRKDNGGGGLEEKEGLFGPDIVQLGHMVAGNVICVSLACCVRGVTGWSRDLRIVAADTHNFACLLKGCHCC